MFSCFVQPVSRVLLKMTFSSQESIARVAEIIPSTKNRSKINIDGFKFVKNKNRDAMYY